MVEPIYKWENQCHKNEFEYFIIIYEIDDTPIFSPFPFSCISFKTGTTLPIWLNGEHPTEVNVTTSVPVCVRYPGNCCGVTYNIDIKKCQDEVLGDDYFVYNLPAAPGCPMSYCIGK